MAGNGRWFQAVMILVVVYCVSGITLSYLANTSTSIQIRTAWRLTCFLISTISFAAHIGYEHFRLRNSPRTAASHASFAVALGAFALALAANFNAYVTTSSHHRSL